MTKQIELIESHYAGDAYAAFALKDDMIVYRRADHRLKIVRGAEARLADAIMNETGVETHWDAVISHLAGPWKARLPGVVVSKAGDFAAVVRTT